MDMMTMVMMVMPIIMVVALAYVVKVVTNIYFRYKESRYNERMMKTLMKEFHHVVESYDKIIDNNL